MRNLVLAVVALCGLAGHALAAPRTVTLVADAWCPYNCDPSATTAPGYLVEATQKALVPLGYTVQYRTEPWTRAVKDVTSGTFDILVATAPVENPQLGMEKISGVTCSFKLFTQPGKTFPYTGISTLKGKRLGAIDDYLYSPELNAYMKENRKNLEAVQILAGDKALDRNIKKLLHNRLDVLVENPAVLRYRMKELGISNTLAVTGSIDQNDRMCYLGLSKATPDAAALAKTLETRMRTLEADGTLAALRTKYSVEK